MTFTKTALMTNGTKSFWKDYLSLSMKGFRREVVPGPDLTSNVHGLRP